jgi:isopentenyldiphosphate isomerase
LLTDAPALQDETEETFYYMHDNQNELLPLVTPDGKVTGCATRGECHGPQRPLHPVVHLHVFNSEGKLYLQLRPLWKDIQPGKWDTAVGGHIDYGEETRDALLRETGEELGIEDFTPEFLTRYVFECPRERELVNVFATVYDGKITPSKETEGGRFFSPQELSGLIGKGKLTPNFESEYKRLCEAGMLSKYTSKSGE